MSQDDDDDNGKRKEMSWMEKENSKTICCTKVRGDSVGYLNLLAFYLSVCTSAFA